RVQDPPAAQGAGGVAQGDELGMRGGVGADLALVVAGADDLAVADDNRAHGDVVVIKGTLGLAQGQAHEVFVTGKETRAHRRRTLPLSVPLSWGNFRRPDDVLTPRLWIL